MTGTLMLSFLALELAAPVPRQPLDTLQGSWVVVSADHDPALGKMPERMVFQFEEKEVRTFSKEGKTISTFVLQTAAAKKPKEMVLTMEHSGKKYILHGIYQFEKNQLVICLGCATGDAPINESELPTEFKGGKNRELLTLERQRSK